MVPDYKSWLEPFIDSVLSNLHTEEYTKLQWIFEHVKPSVYFPFGVKTLYRAFFSPRVCIIREVSKSGAGTDYGQMTGLEPYAVPVVNMPEMNTYEGRPVEGFCLLVGVDERLPCSKENPWKPMKFAESTRETFSKVQSGVYNFYSIDDPKRKQWSNWFEKLCPLTDDVEEYRTQHRLDRPLMNFFSSDTRIRSTWNIRTDFDESALELTEEDWASMPLAEPQPSVATRFDRHPPPPFVFYSDGGRFVTDYLDRSKPYYDLAVAKATNAQHQAILRFSLNWFCFIYVFY
jgi:hypothetical protein